MGAGDNIPECLAGVGYQVETLRESDLNINHLQQFDAVIAGIRAYNTNDRLKHYQSNLMEYVRGGGTYIVQYTTTRNLSVNELGPYPFRLSHDRVSVEDAKIHLIDPDHPVLNFPNKITESDFTGWVQERGLYFADQWDEHYTPILSSHDPGETPKEGGLLISKYGQGNFIYTGYSWFRQLPAGVPGAYRLFTNLISFGNHKQQP